MGTHQPMNVIVFSTNKSKNKLITNKNSPAAKKFKDLKIVMLDLAKQIVADGC